MSQVTVTINGRDYRIACDDGQEDHVRELAGYIDKRVLQLVASVGQVGEPRLLVMASLLIADELSDAYSQIDELQNGRDQARNAAAGQAAVADQAAAAALEHCAQRLEAIAGRLEGA